MLRYAISFFAIAIIAELFGFGCIATGAASIAKIIFFVFIVLFIISILFEANLFKNKESGPNTNPKL